MLMAAVKAAASAIGSLSIVRNTLKMAFNRPAVSREKFEQIPFKELARSATLSKLAYLDPNAVKTQVLKYKKDKLIEEFLLEDQCFYDGNPMADSQAYTWYVKDQRTVYVCFRGTSSLRDAITDIDVRYQVIDLDGTMNIKVHRGFYTQLMAVYGKLMKDLKSREDDFDKIFVVGHSLGSGLSTLAAAEFVKAFPTKEVHCHTFGCPRVGNNEFVKWFNANVKHNWRVFNEQDPVAMVPLSFRFTHVDNGICIDDNRVVKEAKKDFPWWLRIFVYLPFIDFDSPIQDHDCDLYVERLSSFT